MVFGRKPSALNEACFSKCLAKTLIRVLFFSSKKNGCVFDKKQANDIFGKGCNFHLSIHCFSQCEGVGKCGLGRVGPKGPAHIRRHTPFPYIVKSFPLPLASEVESGNKGANH